MRVLVLTVISFFLALPVFCEPILSQLYPKLHLAQDSGSYGTELEKMSSDRSVRERIRTEIVTELDKLRKITPSERKQQVHELLFHWSKTHQRYKNTPLALDEKLGVSLESLISGEFDPQKVADRLLAATAKYERTTLLPMYRQIEKELLQEFQGREVLFLGRDFTPPELFARASGKLDVKQLHMANISRAVMDEMNHGKTKEFWALMEQIGIQKEALIKNGIVILDSSMVGDVPAAVLVGLVSGIKNGSHLYRFLSRSHVRFLESSNSHGDSIAEATRARGGRAKSLSQAEALELARDLGGIDTFNYKVPQSVSAFQGRAHNLIEQRPKLLTSPTGFAPAKSKTRLRSPEPKAPGERVKALLGLSLDLDVVHAAKTSSRNNPCSSLRKLSFQKTD